MSRDELFSMADIVTPNVKEASKLLGDVSLRTISDMRNAAESIYKLGPKYVFSISVKLFCYLFSYPTCALSHSRASDVTSVWGGCQPDLPMFYMNLLSILFEANLLPWLS
jgi:sugar/nucleoside kinase (ribokinase family)